MIALRANISIQILVYVNIRFYLPLDIFSQAKDPSCFFGPNGLFKRGSAYYSPTTDIGQSDPVHGVANNRALPHLDYNRCQLRLNPFARVIALRLQ